MSIADIDGNGPAADGPGQAQQSPTHTEMNEKFHRAKSYFQGRFGAESFNYATADVLPSAIKEFFILIDHNEDGVITADEMDYAASLVRAHLKAGDEQLVYTYQPPAVRDALEAFDSENKGSVSIQDLVKAAEASRRMAKEDRLLKRLLLGVVVLLVILLPIIFGLSFAAAQEAKDVEIGNGKFLTEKETGRIIATDTVRTRSSLYDWPRISDMELARMMESNIVLQDSLSKDTMMLRIEGYDRPQIYTELNLHASLGRTVRIFNNETVMTVEVFAPNGTRILFSGGEVHISRRRLATNLDAAATGANYFNPANKGGYFGSYVHNGASNGGTDVCPGGLGDATCTYQTTVPAHPAIVSFSTGVDETQAGLWGADGWTTN